MSRILGLGKRGFFDVLMLFIYSLKGKRAEPGTFNEVAYLAFFYIKSKSGH